MKPDYTDEQGNGAERMKTMRYEVRTKETAAFVLRNASIEDAAHRAAIRLYGHRNTISVERVTGTTGFSGFFQAYLPRGGGRTSHGAAFHVLPV